MVDMPYKLAMVGRIKNCYTARNPLFSVDFELYSVDVDIESP